jgi:hypothetical protein
VSSLQASSEAGQLHLQANKHLADWGPLEERASRHGIASAVVGGTGLAVGGLGAWWFFTDSPIASRWQPGHALHVASAVRESKSWR